MRCHTCGIILQEACSNRRELLHASAHDDAAVDRCGADVLSGTLQLAGGADPPTDPAPYVAPIAVVGQLRDCTKNRIDARVHTARYSDASCVEVGAVIAAPHAAQNRIQGSGVARGV